MERLEATKRIKEILKRSTLEDFHNVYTPFELCEEMINKLPELNSDMNILVMFNLEFLWTIREKLGKENLKNVWFLTPCEMKKKAAKEIGITENQIVKYEYNNKTIEGEEKMPKFDVCIQNPPYKGTLHLKFLELGFDNLKEDGKMLIINPSSWLVLLREGKTKQKYDLLKNKIEKYTESVEFFGAGKWFNDIAPYTPLEIIYINREKNQKDIKFSFMGNSRSRDISLKNIQSLNEANLIGDYCIIKSIENKIKNKKLESIENHINKEKKKYFININSLVGNGFLTMVFYDGIERKYQNLFNLVNNTSNRITTSPIFAKSQSKDKLLGNIKNYISFESYDKAENFLNFITKSKLCKYLLITYNIDQHIGSTYNLIPWLNWSVEMDDKNIYEFFEFDKSEINLIEQTIESFKIK